MSDRDAILIALVKEVLGPRQGPFENLSANEDPRGEYISGVLAPAQAARPPDDIDSEITSVIEEGTGEEDDDGDSDVAVTGVFSPALDPKALPRSVGLSFTVEAASGPPQIESCATWARYCQVQQGWQRHPETFLTGPVQVSRNQTWAAGAGVALQMRARPVDGGAVRVSLFLVNCTQIRNPDRPETGDHLFQPQIRVICSPGTSLVPVIQSQGVTHPNQAASSFSSEEDSLTLLYRERADFARGHLCGAAWRAIDPERPHPTLTTPSEAPFAWTDAVVVPPHERSRFSPADVRTDMVPCYPVEAPQMDWGGRYGAPPTLDPDVLSETWQPSDVRARLSPLLDGYQNWLNGQQQLVVGLPAHARSLAAAHLQQCQQAADRIRQAIEILAADDDARLAFCFANRAIAIQSRWARGQVLTWRPFQLAFILLNIPALSDPTHSDRDICDLLWFPTGGGKTESYLGLASFAIALRRRRALTGGTQDRTGAGVSVLSRYTLRLLTIQQFRRALGLMTACEMLRVRSLATPSQPVGWRPRQYPGRETFIWGGARFSVGLWVGGGVTPNNLLPIGPIPVNGGSGFLLIAGALDILQGASREYDGPNQTLRAQIRACRHLTIDGEPAQVLTCPCCSATLAVPDEGLGPGQHELHFVFQGGTSVRRPPVLFQPSGPAVTIDQADIVSHGRSNFRTLSLVFTLPGGARMSGRDIDQWWNQTIGPRLGQHVRLLAARAARPGYFILTWDNSQGNPIACNFEIYCPNPGCELNGQAWAEQVPISRDAQRAPAGLFDGIGHPATAQTNELPLIRGLQWQCVPEAFRYTYTGDPRLPKISGRIPIPALTVDDQIYHRCPSMVIATVDKFARLAFEPKASTLFGNVEHYDSRWGHYREGAPPSTGGNLPNSYQPHPPGRSRGNPLHVATGPFLPPDLVLQDELHLIEGPLGSMVGLYETAIELLAERRLNGATIRPKYVASTATVRQAEPQVRSLFNRRLAQFPPSALSADDRFFARDREVHPLDCDRPGRLYVAVCAPGKGAQTPIVRIWASLLQTVYDRWQATPAPPLDRFWTLVGYFNAIRELAGALSLFRQDIPERMDFRAGINAVRPLERWLELSSRANSLDLPSLLERLKIAAPDGPDAVFATSMFGTGVDVDRLGLMVVHGQPKTTASYIQGSGRIGRQGGGLVVTFLRATRPRDLDHYEFFTGYHHALYRQVEPITVYPFSPRARERALGPLSVVLLRQANGLRQQAVPPEWRVQQRLNNSRFHAEAYRMAGHRYDPEVAMIPDLFEERAGQQPDGRRPRHGDTAREAGSELDMWAMLAAQNPNPDGFVYYEPSLLRAPTRHVVLGDAHHHSAGLPEAFENTPQSLREVEETTGFRI